MNMTNLQAMNFFSELEDEVKEKQYILVILPLFIHILYENSFFLLIIAFEVNLSYIFSLWVPLESVLGNFFYSRDREHTHILFHIMPPSWVQ